MSTQSNTARHFFEVVIVIVLRYYQRPQSCISSGTVAQDEDFLFKLCVDDMKRYVLLRGFQFVKREEHRRSIGRVHPQLRYANAATGVCVAVRSPLNSRLF